jgi:hypothetical protein
MNWKRWTICLLRGHKWNRIAYNPHDDSGHFLRCRVCSFENHEGASIRPTGMG